MGFMPHNKNIRRMLFASETTVNLRQSMDQFHFVKCAYLVEIRLTCSNRPFSMQSCQAIIIAAKRPKIVLRLLREYSHYFHLHVDVKYGFYCSLLLKLEFYSPFAVCDQADDKMLIIPKP